MIHQKLSSLTKPPPPSKEKNHKLYKKNWGCIDQLIIVVDGEILTNYYILFVLQKIVYGEQVMGNK